MLTKPLVLAIATFISAGSGFTAASPKPPKPPAEKGEGQHFCCTKVDTAKFSGEGCVVLSKESIDTCNDVLYCDGKWTKKAGIVTCG